MGLNDKIKDTSDNNPAGKTASEPHLVRDTSVKEEQKSLFAMQLLFEEKCDIPDKDNLVRVLSEHIGDVDCFTYKPESFAGFVVRDLAVQMEGKMFPPMLNLFCCTEFDPSEKLDIMVTSQMWDFSEQEKKDVLEKCRWQVLASDMLGPALDYDDRAYMLMDFLEALLELYPQCRAVYFPTGGKVYPADKIRARAVPENQRFVSYAVCRRFFNINGTDGEMIVDTQGMSVLGLPDLQYHYKDIDVNEIMIHAANLLVYIYENNHIKDGDTIDSIKNGKITADVMWECRYENALIQPARTVIDIHTGEFAAGNR